MSTRNYGANAASVVPISDKKEYLKVSNRHQLNSAGIDHDLPDMPDGMDEDAQKHWHFLGNKLKAAGHISSIDFGIMRIYCETYSLYLKAKQLVDERGEYIVSPVTGEEKVAPWSRVRDRHADRLHKLDQKLFLTPQARKGVKVAEKKPELDV